jgi:hypothetical protein
MSQHRWSEIYWQSMPTIFRQESDRAKKIYREWNETWKKGWSSRSNFCREQFVQQHARGRSAEISIANLGTYKPKGASRKSVRHGNVRLIALLLRVLVALSAESSHEAKQFFTCALWGNVRSLVCWQTREKANGRLRKPRVNYAVTSTNLVAACEFGRFFQFSLRVCSSNDRAAADTRREARGART